MKPWRVTNWCVALQGTTPLFPILIASRHPSLLGFLSTRSFSSFLYITLLECLFLFSLHLFLFFLPSFFAQHRHFFSRLRAHFKEKEKENFGNMRRTRNEIECNKYYPPCFIERRRRRSQLYIRIVEISSLDVNGVNFREKKIPLFIHFNIELSIFFISNFTYMLLNNIKKRRKSVFLNY